MTTSREWLDDAERRVLNGASLTDAEVKRVFVLLRRAQEGSQAHWDAWQGAQGRAAIAEFHLERARRKLRAAEETLRQIIEWSREPDYKAGMIDIERAACDGLGVIAWEIKPWPPNDPPRRLR